jgi:hypothetical protein
MGAPFRIIRAYDRRASSDFFYFNAMCRREAPRLFYAARALLLNHSPLTFDAMRTRWHYHRRRAMDGRRSSGVAAVNSGNFLGLPKSNPNVELERRTIRR